MIMVFAMLEEDLLRLVSSEVLVYENEANSFAERRSFVTAILEKAKGFRRSMNKCLAALSRLRSHLLL